MTEAELQLSREARWCVWTYEQRNGGKPAKVPRSPVTGLSAKVDHADAWSTYAEACAKESDYEGKGFLLDGTTGLIGIDVDGCRDPQTGVVTESAQQLIDRCNTYTEVTPSGTGVHILMKGALPQGSGGRRGRIGDLSVELYSRGRFFTFTGNHVPGTPDSIEDRAELSSTLFKELCTEHMQDAAKQPVVATTAPQFLDADEILSRAMNAKNGEKFLALWNGDLSVSSNDHSRADMHLLIQLAFWTRKDSVLMDHLFRRSKLMRRKWDEMHGEKTYGQMSIEKAIALCPTVHTGRADEPKVIELKPSRAVNVADFVAAVESRGPMEWLVEGIIALRRLVLLAGDSCVGKSPLLYQLALCIAAGVKFLGREVKHGKVLMFDYENSAEQSAILLRNICTLLGIRLADVSSNFSVVNRDDCEGTHFDAKLVENEIRTHRPDLVIIDTLSAYDHAFGGSDGPKTYDVIDPLRALAGEIGCTIVGSHHLRKMTSAEESKHLVEVKRNIEDGREIFDYIRGSKAGENATDVRIIMLPLTNRPGVDVVLKGFVRGQGDFTIWVAREVGPDDEYIGFVAVAGESLLSQAEKALYDKLPHRLRHKDARLRWQLTNGPTSRWLRIFCEKGVLGKDADTGEFYKMATPTCRDADVPEAA